MTHGRGENMAGAEWEIHLCVNLAHAKETERAF